MLIEIDDFGQAYKKKDSEKIDNKCYFKSIRTIPVNNYYGLVLSK